MMHRSMASLFSLVVGSISATCSIGCVATTSFSAQLPPSKVKPAIHTALESQGCTAINDDSENQISGTIPSSAGSPFGMTATVAYAPSSDGNETTVTVTVPHSSIFVFDDTHEQIATKIRNQIGIIKDGERANPPTNPLARKDQNPLANPLSNAPPKKIEVPFTGQRHALIVGISNYKDSDYKELKAARRDAEDLAKWLKSPQGGDVTSDRVHILVDGEATRTKIIDNLVRMGSEAKPGDLLIIYFAGHGSATAGDNSTGYLIPYDGDPTRPEATGIEKAEIDRRLNAAQTQRQLMFLDCCFAAASVRDVNTDNYRGFQGLANDRRVIITSTKGTETALDSPRDARNSPFAASLLEALSGKAPDADRNKDGVLTAKELADFLYSDVARRARDAGHEMHPQLFGSDSESVEVTKLRKRDS